MLRVSPYIRLMRLDRPVGVWLLLWPCWWALALASYGAPPLAYLLLFALGAVLMRAAGCIINDIADRKLDAQVERTKNRPLASGELKLWQALVLLFMLLAISLFIALMLGKQAIIWGTASLLPVALYPLMKRITWWPQFFLGLTFNWGALMAWAVMRGQVELPAVLLYIGGVFWTLGYDTIYAHQDKKDDAQIGVKSSALWLGSRTKPAVIVFYALAVLFWAMAAFSAGISPVAYVFLLGALLHFFWQVKSVHLENPSSCGKIFASNVLSGWIVMGAFVIARLIG